MYHFFHLAGRGKLDTHGFELPTSLNGPAVMNEQEECLFPTCVRAQAGIGI
jgi:hypothetical protein